jgi:hypothetical protein
VEQAVVEQVEGDQILQILDWLDQVDQLILVVVLVEMEIILQLQVMMAVQV